MLRQTTVDIAASGYAYRGGSDADAPREEAGGGDGSAVPS